MCFSPQRRAIFSTSELPKVLSEWGVFKHFHFRICFSPQVRAFWTSELTKVVQTRHVLYIFTSESAFRHSGVHFFDGWRAKSASELTCFVHFHLKMCFSPPRRAIFDLSADHLTPHPPALTGLLLDWPDTRIIEKTQHFRDFSNIWRGCIFFLLTFALLHLFFCWLDYSTLLFNCPYCRKFLFKLPSMIYVVLFWGRWGSFAGGRHCLATSSIFLPQFVL